MENKKPALWIRALALITATVLDDFMLICFLIALLMQSWGWAAGFLVVAFYGRLTEIRNAIRSSTVTVSVNRNEPQIRETPVEVV